MGSCLRSGSWWASHEASVGGTEILSLMSLMSLLVLLLLLLLLLVWLLLVWGLETVVRLLMLLVLKLRCGWLRAVLSVGRSGMISHRVHGRRAGRAMLSLARKGSRWRSGLDLG